MIGSQHDIEVEKAVCAICGIHEATPFASVRDYEYATTDLPFTFVSCASCGLKRLDPRPKLSQFGKIYPVHYHPFHFDQGKSIAYLARKLRDRYLANRYRRYLHAGATVLDVGCGDGSLLRILQHYSDIPMSLHGCDLNSAALEHLRSDGISIHPGDFLALDFPLQYFDLIICGHTLEHVQDPRAMLQKFAQCLRRPGGKVILQVPSPSGLNWKLFWRKYWSGYHTPRHFWLFGLRDLEALCQKTGLRMLESRAIPSPGFWMQSILNALNAWRVHGFLRRQFDVNAKPTPVLTLAGLAFFTCVDLVQSALFGKSDTVEVVVEVNDQTVMP